MELTAKMLVEDSIKLYTLPDVYFQVREMIHDQRFSSTDIGKVIAKDPALSMRLLKIVNSSFYGFQSRIDTISRAITIVGMDELHNLVLATSVVDTFNNIPDDLIDMVDFWYQSINCAIIAKLLAKKCAILHEERLFLAGLLHDIGALVIYSKFPEQAALILLEAGQNRVKLAKLEQGYFGFNRAEVGGELAVFWGLPESLSEAIFYQFKPDAAINHKLDAQLLSVAIRLSDAEAYDNASFSAISDEELARLGLKRGHIDGLLFAAADELGSIFNILGPSKKFH
ncbi:MAG: HDOD domain-containing protein [Gammaproteobacteria bacterium]